MKGKILMFSAVILLLIGGAFTMQTNNELARVPKIEGKFIFMCCEPAQNYEVVQGDFSTTVWNIKSPGDFIYPTIKKANGKGWVYDALKVDITGRFELIKFIEE